MEDPCARVRRTCAAVVSRSRSVKIAHPALLAYAAAMRPSGGASLPTPPAWTGPGASPHYADDAASGGHLTAQYVFVLDALNFCFWRRPPTSSTMTWRARSPRCCGKTAPPWTRTGCAR